MAGQLTAIADARRSREPDRDYGVAEAHLGDAPFPDAVDLRRPWHPIADQGQTASCVGWTVADSLVRWHLVESRSAGAGRAALRRATCGWRRRSAERETFPSTFLETDGTSLKAGLDVVRKFGVALESRVPLGRVTDGLRGFNRDVRRRRIMAYYNLGHDASTHELLRRLAPLDAPAGRPVKEDRHLQGTDGDLDGFDEASVTGSHAAALFGYGPDHFLLRSSWGTDWGDAATRA